MDGVIGAIVGGVVFGGVIGALARLVLPGKQEISIVMTVIIGLIGGVAGGLLAEAFGVRETEGFDWIKTIMQVGFAALGVSLYANFRARQGAAT